MPITTSAPYTSANALLTILQRYREKGLGSPINVDVLVRAGVPESLAPRTIQALQVLDLVDEQGAPTATFQKLRTVAESEYQPTLAAWLQSAYADVFQYVDPATDDPTRVRDAFRTYVPHGQQDRMVNLFLALCVHAGLIPEPSKKTDGKPVTTPRKTVARPAAPAAPRGTKAAGVPARTATDFATYPPALAGLLQSIPTSGAGWTKVERDRFVAIFPTVLDFAIPIVSAAETEGAQDE